MPERGGVQGTSLTSPYQVQVNYAGGQGSGWFGPLSPIPPSAPPEVAGRQFDYPSGFNLQTTPRAYSGVTFAELRGLADGYDVLRTVIENSKDKFTDLKWTVRPRDQTKPGGKTKVSAAVQATIDAVQKLFRRPDGVTPWAMWLRPLLEDMFVIDAPTLYCQRTRAGKLMALQILDGGTIKRVIDNWGRTPQPIMQGGKTIYPTAYQQILKGFPAIDYTTQDIIYRPRNMRSNRAYGYSPVEWILMTVNIALRRQLSTLNYFTEGNIPESLIGVPETWTPDQIKSFQDYWDSYFLGNLAQRRHAKFVPAGVGKTFIQTREPELKGDFDEWLARVVCFAFNTSPQPFTKMMNRSSGETHKQASEEEGVEPIKAWIKLVVDDVIENEFDAAEIEFVFAEEDETDQGVQETILSGYTKSGILTLNESRQRLGEEPYSDPAADKLMVLTGTGYVPIDANTIEGKQANVDAFGPPVQPQPFGQDKSVVETSPAEPSGLKSTASVSKGSPDQPRDEKGEWTSGGTGVRDYDHGDRIYNRSGSSIESLGGHLGRVEAAHEELETHIDKLGEIEAERDGFGEIDEAKWEKEYAAARMKASAAADKLRTRMANLVAASQKHLGKLDDLISAKAAKLLEQFDLLEKGVGKSAGAPFRQASAIANRLSKAVDHAGDCACAVCMGPGLHAPGQGRSGARKGYAFEGRAQQGR